MAKKLMDFESTPFIYNYLKMIDASKSEKTLINYSRDIDKFITFFDIQNPSDVEKITKEEFRNFIYEMQKTLGNSSINILIANISPLLSYLLDNELIAKENISTTKFGGSRYLKVTKKFPIVITVDEINDILSHMQEYQSKVIFKFLLGTGVRANELCNLKPADFKDDGTIVVLGKGDKYRVLGMNPELSIVMKEWLEYRDETRSYVFYPSRGRGFKNEKFQPQSINVMIKSALKKTNISKERQSKISTHKTRSTLATLIIATAGIEAARQVLGHASVSITERYNGSHLSVETLQGIGENKKIKKFCSICGTALSEGCECED